MAGDSTVCSLCSSDSKPQWRSAVRRPSPRKEAGTMHPHTFDVRISKFPIAFALLLASLPLLARPVAAQDCAPESSPIARAGDKITVVATLSTSDPNENGEGEALTIESTGAFRQVISTYEVPQSFTFTATVDGETVFGT